MDRSRGIDEEADVSALRALADILNIHTVPVEPNLTPVRLADRVLCNLEDMGFEIVARERDTPSRPQPVIDEAAYAGDPRADALKRSMEAAEASRQAAVTAKHEAHQAHRKAEFTIDRANLAGALAIIALSLSLLNAVASSAGWW